MRLIGDTPKASDVPVARRDPAKDRDTARNRDNARDATRNVNRSATRDTSRAYVRNDTTDDDDNAVPSAQAQRSRPRSSPDPRAYYDRQPSYQQRYVGRGLFQSGW